MVPTSTQVRIQLKRQVSAAAEAVVVLIPQEFGADEPWPLLGEEHRAALRKLLASGAMTGKANELAMQLLDSDSRRRLLVVALGNGAHVSTQVLREAAATAAKAARQQRLRSVVMLLAPVPRSSPLFSQPGTAGEPTTAALAALAEGFCLGSFDYGEYKGALSQDAKNPDRTPPQGRLELTIVSDQSGAALRAALDRARVVADAQNYTRTIASRPGNAINPPALAGLARQLGRQVGLACRILDEKQMAGLGMGGILAVGAGSSRTPPRMVVVQYRPRGAAARQRPPLLVVGKAITFDTGGISIKPAEKMGRMIFDKCGGAAVLGLMYAVAKLKPAVGVVGILSSAENHISETAYRPGDILRMYNGITVEVTNTDAEGRLVLGDALAWGIETFQPAAAVDLATLTGGVIVALGKSMAGLFSNNDALAARIQQAADLAGEKVWRLPLGPEQREQLKSDPADIVNSAGREAQPLQGGAFLSYFVPSQTPWVHLDIAGVADTEKDLPLYAKGATGWGVRTLVQWVMDVATDEHPTLNIEH